MEVKMIRSQTSGWKMWKLLPGSSSRSRSDRAASVGGNTAIVRLIDSPRRSPTTQIEEQLVSALKKVFIDVREKTYDLLSGVTIESFLNATQP